MTIKLSKSLFFFLFIFAPLAFGSSEPWSLAILQVVSGSACFFFLVHCLLNKQPLYRVPGLTPLILFLIYILFGLLPLPPGIVAFLSPKAYEIHMTQQQLADISAWMTISVHPKATIAEFFRYAAYVMFYALTVQLLKDKATLKATALVIALFGGLLAFSSILQFYLTDDVALWFRPSPINSIVVGPYVNHNHYAGLMEMIFPVVLGLFLFYRPRIGNTPLLKGIIQIFNQERANIHLLIGAAALLIVVSIFVSLSRGAMISSCLSLIVFTYFLLKRKISKGNTTILIGVIMASALAIGWFGWDQILHRFANLKNAHGIIYESRLVFWKNTIDLIKAFFLTGSGIGTFSDIYPTFRTFLDIHHLFHAHNDYLELLAEGGIIGFILCACFIITLLYKTNAVYSRRRDAFSIYLYIGCLTAIVAMLLHSFVDFNLHVGANGLWFFFIAGIMVSAANTGLQKTSRETRLPKISSGPVKWCTAISIGVVTALLIVFNGYNLIGRFYYVNIKNYDINAYTPSRDLKRIEKVAEHAARFDPLEATYHFVIANTAWFSGDSKKARTHFLESIRLNPIDGRHMSRLAIFYAKQEEIEKAGIAFKASTKYDAVNADYAYQYGFWLLAQDDISEGLKQMRSALSLDEAYFDKVLTAMIVSGIDKNAMEAVIPPLPGPTIAYANFLATTGELENAIQRYLSALDLIRTHYEQTMVDHQIDRFFNYYHRIFKFFKKYNDMKNAMKVMEHAERTLPADARIKVILGNLYYRQGITYKALEKYEDALLLDPANRNARDMIRKINQ